MNKIFFITFVACSVVFSFSAHAQSGKQHRNFDREAFFAKKNAFITAEMGLTPEEAASFIPLCNELQEKMFEAGRECRKLSKDLKPVSYTHLDVYKRQGLECRYDENAK